MIKFVKDFKNTNFYYFYRILIDNNLKLFFFFVIGLLIGYYLHINSQKELVIIKKIYPINESFHFFRDVIGQDTIFNDFIRIHRENVTENEYKQIFEINPSSAFVDKSPSLFRKKIPTNITYNEYLNLSEDHNYLKERIDYEFDIYHISKSITYRIGDNELENRVNNLKNNFDKYLKINNQILRYKIFQNLFENPAFYKKVLLSLNSELILVDHEYFVNEIFKKNSNEIKKITKILRDMIDPETSYFFDQETLRNKEKNNELSKHIKNKDIENYNEPIKFSFKGNTPYSFEQLQNAAGIELDRIFQNYFKNSVNGIYGNFQTKTMGKSVSFYLVICSVISVGVLISFLLIRDFVRILRQN